MFGSLHLSNLTIVTSSYFENLNVYSRIQEFKLRGLNMLNLKWDHLDSNKPALDSLIITHMGHQWYHNHPHSIEHHHELHHLILMHFHHVIPLLELVANQTKSILENHQEAQRPMYTERISHPLLQMIHHQR